MPLTILAMCLNVSRTTENIAVCLERRQKETDTKTDSALHIRYVFKMLECLEHAMLLSSVHVCRWFGADITIPDGSCESRDE